MAMATSGAWMKQQLPLLRRLGKLRGAPTSRLYDRSRTRIYRKYEEVESGDILYSRARITLLDFSLALSDLAHLYSKINCPT